MIQFDIDGLEPDEAEYLKGELRKLQEVAFLGLSVSGKGLWGLIPIAYPEKHRQHFEALAEDFRGWGIELDENPKNVASLRGYSWDAEAYFNPQARTYTKLPHTERIRPSQPHRRPQAQGDEAWKVEACLEVIEAGRIDITGNYGDWLAVGFALADEFGQAGRDYFHRASQFFPKYRPSEADRQYTACLKHGKKTSLGTFFEICRQYGVTFGERLKAERIQPHSSAQAPRPALSP